MAGEWDRRTPGLVKVSRGALRSRPPWGVSLLSHFAQSRLRRRVRFVTASPVLKCLVLFRSLSSISSGRREGGFGRPGATTTNLLRQVMPFLYVANEVQWYAMGSYGTQEYAWVAPYPVLSGSLRF